MNNKRYIKKDRLKKNKEYNCKLFNKLYDNWKRKSAHNTGEYFLSLINENLEIDTLQKWKRGKIDFTQSKDFENICKILEVKESDFLQTQYIEIKAPLHLMFERAIFENFNGDYQVAEFIKNNLGTSIFQNIKEVRSEIEKCERATDENIKALIDKYNDFAERKNVVYKYNTSADNNNEYWCVFFDTISHEYKIASPELIQTFIDQVYYKTIDFLQIRNNINNKQSVSVFIESSNIKE